jgi:hypothetical protein
MANEKEILLDATTQLNEATTRHFDAMIDKAGLKHIIEFKKTELILEGVPGKNAAERDANLARAMETQLKILHDASEEEMKCKRDLTIAQNNYKTAIELCRMAGLEI